MDASLLMSPDYKRPLVPSDLSNLTHQLLEPDNIQWLQHCAVKKFLRWRRDHQGSSLQSHRNEARALALSDLYSHSRHGSIDGSTISAHSGVLVPHPSRTIPADFSTTATQPHIHIASWAQDLQRALDAERRRFCKTDVSGQVVLRGTQVIKPSRKQQDRLNVAKETSQYYVDGPFTRAYGTGSLSTQDPLGILALGKELSKQGWLALRILGGCGVFATMAVWLVRNWGVVTESFGFRSETHLPQYALYGSGRDDWKGMFLSDKW